MASRKSLHSSFLVLGIILASACAHGDTWFVAQDGTGHYAVIQDAVNAAQDGDTIMIRPGHYTDFTVVAGYGQTPSGARVNVVLDGTKSLTFIGAGPEATIIGPLVHTPPSGPNQRSEFGFLGKPGGATIKVENLRVMNHDFRGMSWHNQQVELQQVTIEMCYIGVQFTYVNNVLIEGCLIQNSPHHVPPSEIAILSRSHTVLVRDTVVRNYSGGVLFSVSSTDVLVDNCQVTDGIGGIEFQQGASGIVQNSYLSGHQNYGLIANDAGTVVFRNNVIEDLGVGIGFHGAQNLTVHDNEISRTRMCVYITSPNVTQSVYNNHFLRNPDVEGYYVKTRSYYPYGPYYFDFTNNYWGTTDPEEVSTWIYDGYDNPDVWMYVVFEPMADGPVPVQRQTWTEVKGLFRD